MESHVEKTALRSNVVVRSLKRMIVVGALGMAGLMLTSSQAHAHGGGHGGAGNFGGSYGARCGSGYGYGYGGNCGVYGGWYGGTSYYRPPCYPPYGCNGYWPQPYPLPGGYGGYGGGYGGYGGYGGIRPLGVR